MSKFSGLEVAVDVVLVLEVLERQDDASGVETSVALGDRTPDAGEVVEELAAHDCLHAHVQHAGVLERRDQPDQVRRVAVLHHVPLLPDVVLQLRGDDLRLAQLLHREDALAARMPAQQNLAERADAQHGFNFKVGHRLGRQRASRVVRHLIVVNGDAVLVLGLLAELPGERSHVRVEVLLRERQDESAAPLDGRRRRSRVGGEQRQLAEVLAARDELQHLVLRAARVGGRGGLAFAVYGDVSGLDDVKLISGVALTEDDLTFRVLPGLQVRHQRRSLRVREGLEQRDVLQTPQPRLRRHRGETLAEKVLEVAAVEPK